LASSEVALTWQILRAQSARRTISKATESSESEARFSAFMDHSPLVSFVKDHQGRLIYANRRFIEVFLPTLGSDFLGKDDFELWPPVAAAKIRSDDLRILAGDSVEDTIDVVPAGDGKTSTWLSTKFPFVIGGQRFLGGQSVEITDRESAKEALRASEERFRTAFENAAVGMTVTDRAGRFLEVNRAFCEITGYSPEELLDLDFLAVTYPDDRALNLAADREASKNGLSGFRIEKRYLRKDLTTVWVRVSVGTVRDRHGTPVHRVALVEDISKEKRAAEDALLSEQRWQLALQAATDGIWDWDGRNDTLFFSPRWKEMLGYTDEELPNRTGVWELLLHPEERDSVMATLAAHLERKTPDYSVEYRMRCKNGHYKWVLARGKAIWDSFGKPLRLIGTHTDITERKDAEEKLRYQAEHDPLTGLVNRRYFLDRLTKEVPLAIVNGKALSFCVCDLDRFKEINDRHGHQAGDDVLVTFSNILREGIRDQDLAGRIGGDEFWVFLPDTTATDAAHCIERIRDRFETTAFSGGAGTVFAVTASFGVAELETHGTTNELIEAADRALYAAKGKGRNTVSALSVRD
jgi:diguanylate cyclase (GGDEF)-like protein/PAS domain S-box-containing protein